MRSVRPIEIEVALTPLRQADASCHERPTSVHSITQRAALRKASDGKLMASLWLILSDEELGLTDWIGLSFALRMSVLSLAWLLAMAISLGLGLLLGPVGLLLITLPGFVGSTILLVWLGLRLIPKPKPATWRKKARYLVPLTDIAEIRPASDSRDGFLIVHRDGSTDMVHVVARDQFVATLQHALAARRS